jgi:Xaa-Pro aminopeptidase
VEPWYYNHDENIAVFTEEVVAVTDKGADVLTAALPHSPEALEKMVGGR